MQLAKTEANGNYGMLLHVILQKIGRSNWVTAKLANI